MPSNSTNVGTIDLSLILNSSQFQNQLRNVVRQSNQASNKISNSLSGIGKAVVAAFSITAITAFGKECVKVASDTTNAWIGLKSILDGQNKSFNSAREYINEYVSDGLVPLNNAVTAYKNLASRGYNTDQIKSVMSALKDAATFGRQSSYSLGEAIESAAEGLKNENSILVDNAGVTKNVAKMWEDYAKSIGKTANNLTQQEKIQAEVNGILEETKFQMGDANLYSETYSGKVAKLNSAFSSMKVAVGNVVQPLVKAFIPVLITATNAVTALFNKFASLLALFGLRADSVETIFNGFEKTSANAEETSEAIEGIGDSASKAGKKISKSLAGFDEMNKLNVSNGSGSGGGSSGVGGMDLAGLTEGKDPMIHLEEDTRLLDALKAKVQELADIFKNGFNISFGNTNFNGILGHLRNIKDILLDIGTNPAVVNAGNNFVNSFTFNLGKLTGTVSRIGTNIAEGLVGSINTYLSQNTERIKNFIINMFNISSEQFALIGNFSEALGKISDVFKSDTVKQIGADIIAMFSNPFMSALEIAGNFVTDLIGIFVQPVIDNVDKIKSSIENTLKPIQKITGKVAEGFTLLGDKLNKAYDEKIRPMYENVKNGLSDSFGKFLDVYNEYVAPILKAMADKFTEVWDNKIYPMLENFIKLIEKCADTISVLWDTVLKPTIDWIIQNIVPVVAKVFKALWDFLMDFFGYVSDTINGIIDILKGVLDFIVGIFTGDWKKAWEGIKQIVVGIFEAIKGFIMTIVSGIATIIMSFIAGLQAKFTLFLGFVKAIFTAIAKVIESIWNGIKDVAINIWNAITEFLSNTFNGIKDTVSNIFNGIKDTISNIWDSILSKISDIWNNIKNKVKEGAEGAWNAVTSIFGNIGDWLHDKFSQAWQRVKDVFSKGGEIFDGIKEGILNGLKTVVNAIISGINKVISVPFNGINSALKKIKNVDILGYKPFDWIKTISVPQIPKLAQGGFVKANTPQLAIIGDNKTQGEIVAPEDKMLDMIMKALKMFNEQSNNNNGGDIIVPIYMDGELIQRKTIRRNERLSLATNGRA